jgi:hypothetical protein
MKRHEKTNLHPHFCEITIGQGQFVLLILDNQYRMLIQGLMVGLAVRQANANDW